MFVIDDLLGWLVGKMADAGYKKLAIMLRGSDLQHALNEEVTAAVAATVAEIYPSDAKAADRASAQISQAFHRREPIPLGLVQGTLLEALQVGIAAKLSVLDEQRQDVASLPGIRASEVAPVLTGHLVRQILLGSLAGGPLTPLADQLNHDMRSLEGQELKGMVAEVLQRLDEYDIQSAASKRVTPGSRVVDAPWQAHSYIAHVRQIDALTPDFEGREQELRDAAAFAHGKEGYRLIAGQRNAGKTALLARFVRAHVPDDVEVVAFFASRRMYDADSRRFLSAVVPQLAAVAAEEVPDYSQDAWAFERLWERAAEAVADRQHHLLLVVDGLDEDRLPQGLSSIAAILPAAVAGRGIPHAHVLVSTRDEGQKRQLAPDIGPGHPLAGLMAELLAPYGKAEKLEESARQEIADLRTVAESRWCLGVLAAAGGALSEADLVRLTGLTSGEVSEFLRGARRSLPPTGDGRYAFDTDFLLDVQAIPDLEIDHYREIIHNWADEWQRRGWQEERGGVGRVPRYLLDSYPEILREEPARMGRLIGDPGWVTAAIRELAVDTVLAKVGGWLRESPDLDAAAAMLAIVRGQAAFLRAAAGLDSGQLLRQLCLQAAELEEADQVAAFLAALRTHAGLVPLWSSRRPYRALAAEINGRAGWVNAVVLTPGGRVLVGADDGRIWLWDPQSPAAEMLTIGKHRRPVRALALHGDGRIVSAGDDRRVLVWNPNVANAEPVELGRHDGAVRALAIVGSDRVVSGGDDWWVRIWSLDGNPDRDGKLGQHAGSIRGLAVDAQGRVVSGGDDGRLSLWDPDAPGAPMARAEAVDARIMTVAVASDQSVIAGGNDGIVYRWHHLYSSPRDFSEQDDGLVYERLGELGSHGNVVRGIAVTDDGMTVTGADDGRVRLWHPTERGTERIELGQHDGAVRCVAASEGRAASGGRDQRVRFWDIGERHLASRRRGGHAEQMFAACVCPDGWVISGGISRKLWLWDPAGPAESAAIGTLAAPALAICALPGTAFITADGDGVIQAWDRCDAREPLSEIPAGQHPGAVLCLAAGYLITAGYDGRVLRWDLADVLTRRLRHQPPGPGGILLGQHSSPVVAVAALPDGRVATGAVGGDVIVWRPDQPGRQDRSFDAPGGRVNALCVVEDLLVVGGDDGLLHVWNLGTGSAGISLPAHDAAWLTSLTSFGPYVVSAGTDGRMVAWERHLAGLRIHSEVTTSITALWSCTLPDGDGRIAAAHAGGGLSYWALMEPSS